MLEIPIKYWRFIINRWGTNLHAIHCNIYIEVYILEVKDLDTSYLV